MKHLHLVQGILLLPLAASCVFAQMKSASLDPDAWYSIIAVHSGKALEIEGGVEGKATGLALQQNAPTGADNQLFQFRQVQSGFFKITAKHSSKVLEIRDSSMIDHARVQQNEFDGKDSQLFTLVKETSGNYRFIARSTGYGFDVSGGVKSTGDNIAVIVYPATGATNQTFRLVEAFGKQNGQVGNDYVPPFDAAAAGLTPLFDGQTLAGWVGDPACWKVIDGVIVGLKDNQNLMTAGDYDDFRIIVSSRQVSEPSNHQGVGFWGERMPEGKYGYGGCVLVMPPMPWTWDYTVNKGAPGTLTFTRDLDKELGIKRFEWTQAEVLVCRAKGTIRMAVNGVQVLSYVDNQPSRLKKGPIGLQAHAGNHDVRYKDIFIEVAPKEDRLITLKK
jgi:hypothetical protein